LEFSIQNKGDSRIYYLQCESEKERDQWLKELKDRSTKVEPPTLQSISIDFQLFYIVTTANEKSYAEFVIKVNDNSTRQQWTVLKRYSEMRSLHKKVR